MWLRLGLILGRVLLRVGIRLAPFAAVALAGLFRRYRWPLYYKAQALKPRQLSLALIPRLIAGFIAALLLLGIALYFVVGVLAPSR